MRRVERETAVRKKLFRPPQRDPFPGAGNGRVDQFTGEHRGIPVGQNEHDLVELRPLAFVDRCGKYRFMFGEPQRVKGSEAAFRAGEEHARSSSRKKVGQEDPHIAVEEVQVVVVASDEDGPAHVPLAFFYQELLFLEEIFDQPIQRGDATQPFPHGTKDSELQQEIKNFLNPSRRVSVRVPPDLYNRLKVGLKTFHNLIFYRVV